MILKVYLRSLLLTAKIITNHDKLTYTEAKQMPIIAKGREKKSEWDQTAAYSKIYKIHTYLKLYNEGPLWGSRG